MDEFDMINDNYNVLRKKYPLALKEQPVSNLLFKEPDSGNVFIQPQVQEQPVEQVQPVQVQVQPQPQIPVIAPTVPAVAPVTSVPATPTSNVLAGQRPPYVPQTEYEKYWGQKVGTENVGIPLNRFVGLAGKAAYALDPKGFGGILGKQLSDEADVATQEMARREYEGPNKLLQQRLTTAQVNRAENEVAAQSDVSGFITKWPETANRLALAGKTKDEIDSAFVEDLSTVYAKHNPEAAAALREKAIEARRSGKLRDLAQQLKDQMQKFKIEQAKLEYAKKLASDKSLADYRKSKLGLEGERLKVAKEKAAKSSTGWYAFGTDPVTKKIVYVNKDGESKLGDLPKDVASVAPKVEKPMTEKQKSEEETAKIVRLALINRNRRRDGLSPLNELPVEGVKKESKDIKSGSKEQALEAIENHKSNPEAVKAIKDTYKKLHPGDSL